MNKIKEGEARTESIIEQIFRNNYASIPLIIEQEIPNTRCILSGVREYPIDIKSTAIDHAIDNYPTRWAKLPLLSFDITNGIIITDTGDKYELCKQKDLDKFFQEINERIQLRKENPQGFIRNS